MELNNLLQGLLGELQKISKSESVVGKPLQFGDAHLVPLSRVTVGFGTGTSDLKGSGGAQDGSFEAGGAAGALTVEPRAFVVVASDGVPQLLAMHKGSASLQAPVELPAPAADPAQKRAPKTSR
jgi:uncharacterized spore protein YtfJ